MKRRKSVKFAGAAISGELRESLVRNGPGSQGAQDGEPAVEYGFRPSPKRGGVVTNELIDRLREETGD